jgi:WD40-like Beta Propeller Repeat
VDLTADAAEPLSADHPSWSPDGTKLAFRYVNSLKVVAPDGTGSTTIVGNLGEVWELSWSPDGTKIAFANDVGGPLQEELFLVNADGNEREVRGGLGPRHVLADAGLVHRHTRQRSPGHGEGVGPRAASHSHGRCG